MINESNLVGREIGNYRIIAKIAQGAFGSVYTGKHTVFTSRPIVAVKLLHTYLSSPEERQIFFQEAQLLEVLKHPFILPIIDAGIHENIPYLVVEFASGGSLRDKLQHLFPSLLPIEEALTILSQIGQALQYAHKQNVIHRDLKPENILFNDRGHALLADFGIATLLATASLKQSRIIGTPFYMAPEQFRGTISRESDQYAMGCIAYEIFTGSKPFNAPDFVSLMFKHVAETPIAPKQLNHELPLNIEQAILTAMMKERTKRYTNISSFISALQMSAQNYLIEGKVQYTAKNFTEALFAYNHAIQLDPHFALAYKEKGWALRMLSRFEEAVIAFDQAIQLDPNLAGAYFGKGNTLMCFNNVKKFSYLDDEEDLGKGNTLMCLNNRLEEAILAFDQAIQLDPNLAGAYLGKGNALGYLNNRLEEAILAFDQAIQLDPDKPFYYSAKGLFLEGKGKDKEALPAFEKVTQLDPNNVDAWVKKWEVLKSLNRFQEAEQAYEMIIKLDGYNHSALVVERYDINDEIDSYYDD